MARIRECLGFRVRIMGSPTTVKGLGLWVCSFTSILGS